MLKTRSMLRYVVAIALFAGALVTSAQTQPTALDDARSQIIKTIGAEKDAVVIVTTVKTVTVERINSNLNGSSHGGRNNEAAVIGPIVAQAIGDKPEFKDVVVIRVQYLRRSSPGSKDGVVDTIEFRKDAGGKFQFHET
jgi:hypothetical protein